MAMRVFYRRHASSSRFLWASIPFYPTPNVNSFMLPSSTSTHHIASRSCGPSHFGRDVTTCHDKRKICLECHRCNTFFRRYFTSVAWSLPNWRHNSCTNPAKRRHPPPFSLAPYKSHQFTTSRLFGSNPAASNTPGEINLSDDRDDMTTLPIDMAALHKTIDTVRDILGYPTYDISLTLIDEDFMKEVNSETRGVDSSTDVLSFSFTECIEPGVLEEVPPHGHFIGEMYCLGDLLICVDYVARRCEEDRIKDEQSGVGQDVEVMEGEVVAEDSTTTDNNVETEQDDGEYEYQDIEVEVLDEWDDRGVAPALLTTYNPEIRIHMLIVHGMLHLVGYDHIEDDDYELMVLKEDEVMAELKRRLGNDFGLGSRALPTGNIDDGAKW